MPPTVASTVASTPPGATPGAATSTVSPTDQPRRSAHSRGAITVLPSREEEPATMSMVIRLPGSP